MVIIGIKHRYDNRPNLTSWAITSWTNSPYTHSEIFVNQAGDWQAYGARPDRRGVSCKLASEVIRNPLWWQFFEVPVPDEPAAIAWLHEQCGSGYNWRGVAYSQVLTLGLYDDDDWFCSEFAYVFARLWSSLHLSHAAAANVDPGDLRDILLKSGAQSVAVLP